MRKRLGSRLAISAAAIASDNRGLLIPRLQIIGLEFFTEDCRASPRCRHKDQLLTTNFQTCADVVLGGGINRRLGEENTGATIIIPPGPARN